ncbi:5-methyltetrahydrofolate--homocysteine methyltransferase [Thermotomaculum hydrothermale]|uniref:Methionine synthase n=1 Tax=Thermotomaculum hydrothermale TaxID=981385 RepID=A0A7R6PX87_9BACT|nr:homocysteine S-methyltransferase family protein [Thermotomaculum hydrothermale]BBB32345.1 5-methyltetrahydrofolate--homocysteine methyltransferase [Thermotomaculum hydrothermale]
MNRKEFIQLLFDKILILDGAYGTQLSASIKGINFPEEANIVSPETVLSLHKNYIDAGADIIKTNTFGLFHLFNTGKIDKNYALKLLKSGVEIGVKAAKEKSVFCFASFGPMSDSIFSYSAETLDFFIDFYSTATELALLQGVQGILFETFSDFLELKLAVYSVRKISNSIPVIAQFTLNSNGATIQGVDAKNCGAFLDTIDCDVAGLNCSTGPLDMALNFESFSEYISKPMSASPNAGLPELRNGEVYYPDIKKEFKKALSVFLKNGARIVGSCCGSNPDYTRAIKEEVNKFKGTYVKKNKKDFLVSPDFLVDFENKSFFPIGERLNLLGNKTFKENYLKNFENAIEIEVNRQITAGAKCLDFNVDLIARDDYLTAKRDIIALQNFAKPIISIDTLYLEVMNEVALYSACTPLYNSADLTEKRFNFIAELYKKFGGKIIVLLMSGKKVPKTFEERLKGLELVDMFVEEYEIDKRDIFVDPLALTLGTGVENYHYVEEIIEKSKYKTIVGLSNFSHGLPDRSRLNSFLLTNLIRRGLTASILDISDPNIASVIFNNEAIFEGKGFSLGEKNGLVFKGEFSKWGEYLIKGDIENLTREIISRLEKRDKATFLLEKGLIENMEKIGSYFEKGAIYLPQLLSSAETMKNAFETLKPYLEEELAGENKNKNMDNARILLFTVQNDVHDIGKNIVLTVLKSFGFSVFDGGIDKSPDEIIEEINSTNARVVGLSALMTTSLPYMRETVKKIKESLPEVKVIVGGAVVTKRFAEEIGADGYGKNAFDAVNLVRNLL